MNRLISLLIAGLALLTASPASAQEPEVSVKLHAKVQGDDVLVAVEFKPSFGCWIYDDGDPGPYAVSTTVTFGGLDGAAWTEAWFPEPKAKETPGIGTNYVFKKRTYAYGVAVGAASDGLSPADVTALAAGQVCNEGGCLQFSEELADPGEGSEKVWAGFPAELLNAPATVADAAPETSEDSGDDEIPPLTASVPLEGLEIPQWSPMFGDARAAARAFARAEGDVVEVVIQVATPEKWHMYHGPTSEEMGPGLGTPTVITIEGGGAEWGEVIHPQPFRYGQGEGDDEWLWAYDGTFHFGVRGGLFDEFDPEDVTITVTGQSCDENSCVNVALAPEIEGTGTDDVFKAAFASFTMPGGEGEISADGAPAADAAGTRTTPGIPIINGTREFGQRTQGDGLLAFILLAIGAGLFTLLMPCTYPMIPITISYFTKQAEGRGGRVLSLALAYGAGIVLIFVILGVLFGPIMGQIAALPSTNIVIGILFIVFALALFGMIDLKPPAFMMNFAGNASSKGGYFGVFLMGLTLVITSFTCTGPFVGSLLAAGSGNTWVETAIGMGAFGLTMATPFVILALVPGKLSAIPSAGSWMNTIKVFMGFVELAAAMKFFSNADISLDAMMLPREVFLILWTGIAFVAAMYLFGRINLKGESPDGNIGPGRMLAGTATSLGGFYCLLGAMGYQLDSFIMSAMAPPPGYTRGLVDSHSPYRLPLDLPEGVEVEAGGAIIVEDDYDLALEIARERDLGLIVNFTGHT